MPDKKNNAPRRKALNMNSPWLQNTLRSMGISATNALSDLMPATSGTVTSGARLASDAARTIRSTRGGSKMVQNAIKNNQLVKTGQDFFKNALDDIRSGEWNGHDDRGSMGDMFDDMDTMFGDMDEMFSDDEDVDVSVENNVVEESGASIRAINKQSEYTVRAAQATVDTMVSIGSATLIKAEELGNKVLNELTGINSTLNAILEYQNSNVTRFIEASIGYYEQMAAVSDASSYDESIKPENLYGDRGLDFGTYKDYVIQNIKNLKSEDGSIGMISMFLENAPDMLANPMDMAAKGIIKAMIPTVTKNAMAAVDQSMKDFVPYLLERIGSLGEGQMGITGTALQYIGKIFGTKTTAKKELDFSNIKTGPIPYNGKANHTLVEIIPKYLRESNNYLRVIAEHLTGKNADDLADSVTGFNWQTGRFQSMGDMKNSMQEDYVVQVLSGLETSEFGKKFLATANTVLENSSDVEGMGNILQQILLNGMQSGKRFNFGDENQIQEIVDGISGTENQKNFVTEFLSQMKEQSDEVLGNLENLRISTVRKNNTLLRGLNDENNENGIYQLYAGKSKEDILEEIKAYLQNGSSNQGGTEDSDSGDNPPPTPGPAPTIQSRESLREAIRTNQNDELELDEINNSGGGVRGAAGRAAAKPLTSFARIMNGIMAGNADAAWDAFIAGFGETFNKAGKFISDHFLNPIKGALFGEKNEDGYIKGGLFGGINNRMKESFFSLRRMITGKGYRDAEGNMVADANDEEMKNTVVGKLRTSVNWMKDAISVRLFGKKDENGSYEVDEDGKEKDGLLGKTKRGINSATSSLLRGLTGWKHALFGKSEGEEDEETEGKKIFENLKKKAADVAPSAMTGALGGGIMGMMVGGPLGGALLGFAGGIASHSDRFKKWLFGTEDKDGVIPKSVQDYVKENGKFLAGGAAIGALKGALTGGGLLGTLVGGPVAGALMGLGTSIFLKSDTFQKFWFGDAEAGQLGMKQHIAQWTKSLGMNTATGDADGGKLAGMMGVGAIGGGILGMMVGGPVLGALGGLSLSILAQKDNFKEWLFGKVDEETGEKKEGVLGQFKNMLITEIGRPIKTTVKYIVDDFKGFFKYNIVQPVGIIIGAAGDQIASTFKVIGGTIGATVGDFGHYIKENFLSNVVAGLGRVFAPMTKAATTIAEGMYAAGKAVISAPIKMISAIMSPAAHVMATAVKGVTAAIGATVNIAIVKPLEYLVFKPLGAAVNIASKVIAAPFKLVANTVTWVNDHLIAGLKHITRFFGAIGDDIKMKFFDMTKKVGDKIHEKVIEPIQKFVLTPIKIIGDGIKEVLYDVGQFTKRKISGFFSKALSLMNPFNWIKGVFNLGRNAINLIGGRFGFDNRGENSDDSQQSGGYFSRMWNQTKAGNTVDHSNTLVYDDDGNIVDSKLSPWQRIRMSMRDGKQIHEGRKMELKEARSHDKNASLVRKYTKGQRADDTEESRMLAERMAGHKINWKGKAEESKTEKFQDESLKAERKTADYIEKLYSFITGKKVSTASDRREGRAEAAKQGFEEQQRQDSRRTRINELRQEEGYHARRDVRDAKNIDRRVSQRERNLRREQVDAEIASGADARTVVGNSFARMWGKLKGHFTTPDEEIPANAEGTTGAKPGFSIVGEKGPEVIYGKNAKNGRFVGLGGPEVVKMRGGETVIPNDRLPKYEDGTDDVPTLVDLLGGGTAKTDDAISRATDTSKLTLGERVLRVLTEIKTSVLGKIGVVQPKLPSAPKSVTGQLDEEPEAAATLAPAQTTNLITDSSNTDMVNDGEENSMADQLSAQAVVSGLTGEAQRAEHAAIKEQAEDDARKDAMLAAMQGTHEETKKHGISWDSIFSKKGLITAALLAAIPLLLKFLKSGLLQSILDALGGLGSRLLNGVGSAIENVVHQAAWTYENDALENGETVGQRMDKDIARVAGLQIFDENGQADHISFPFAKALARLGLTFANSGVRLAGESTFTSGVKGASNIIKGFGSTVLNGARSIANFGRDSRALADLALEYGDDAYNLADNGLTIAASKGINFFQNTNNLAKMIGEYGDDALELADNKLMAWGAKGINAVNNAATKVSGLADNAMAAVANNGVVQKVGGLVDNAANFVGTKSAAVVEKLSESKGGKLLTYVCETIQTFFSSMIAKFNAKTGLKAGESILSKINPARIINCIKSGWDNICVKISELLGGRVTADAVSAGLMEAVFVGLSAINGVSGTAKLFHVRSDAVDAKMRIIAGLFGGILGTTPGAVVDLVCALVFDMTGIDVLCSLATGFYNFWAGEDEGAKLEDAQSAFEGDYVDYQSAEISKQYETQKAAGLINPDMTLEQFSEEAHAGNLGIDYDSFANYNAKVNASFGDKAMQGLSSAWGGIQSGWNWLTGKDEVSYTDDRGNVYTKNKDGTYQVTSANGEDLGYVAATALEQGNMTETIKENDNIFQRAGKGLAGAGNALWNGVKGAGEWLGGAVSTAGNAIVNTGKKVAEVASQKWDAFKDGVKWLTSRETTTGYYYADGTYYLPNGEHYTANNELIETISLSDLSAMIVSGQLSEPTEIVTKDFGFITAFNDAKKSLAEGWDNTVKNAQQFGANVLQKAKDFGASASQAFENAKVSVVNFFTDHSEKAWFDMDGSYWKVDGKKAVHYNATGSQIGDPLDEDEFAALLSAGSLTEGEVQVDSGLKQKVNAFGKSLADGWNKFTTAASNLGNSLVQSAGSALNKAKEKLGSIATSVGNFLMDHTEKRYHDTQGGYYQSNGSTFDYYNQNGDLISEGISAEEFASLVQSGVVSENDVEEVTVNSGIRSWFNEMAESGKKAYTQWHDNAVAMWGPVVEKAGSAVKAIAEAGGPIAFIGGLFTKKTEKAWYDTNGNYYKLGSGGKYTKYNMNGDVLEENIDPEKIQDLAEAGLLTEGDVVVDTAAQKAVKEIKSAVKDAWSAAKDTVKSGWESFKNWITGGSGTNSSVINNYRPDTSSAVMGGSGYGPRNMFIRGGRGESEPTSMNGVPYYSQNDTRWANNSYEPLNQSDGATMSNTGCGPAAMSMVIGKMTGQKTLPTELASYAQFTGTRDETGTNWNFIDSAASTYGLQSTRSVMPSKEFISHNLANGNPMVLSGQSDGVGRSPYTRAGHYIVATGVDSSGNITYNDPRGASYSGTMNIDEFINNTGAAWSFTGPDAPRGSYGISSISNRQRFNMYEWTRQGGRGYETIDVGGGSTKTSTGTGVTSSNIISIASNEVGYRAKASNASLDSKDANPLPANKYNGYTKYSRDTWPGKNGLAWCAMFVCWVFKMAANGKEDIAKKLLCNGGYSAGCTQMLQAFKSKGQLVSKNDTPIPGDVVLFNWDNGNSTTTAQHVGIVVGTNGDKVTTIEGNTSANSQGHGGSVEKKDRSRTNIICFCRPIYDNTSSFQGLSSLGVDTGDLSGSISSTVAGTSGGILSDYSTLFSAFANAAFNAALTGNTDIDWNSVYSGANSGLATTDSTDTSTSGGVVDPGDINERTKKVVEFFRSKGINDAAIAGVLGCWKAESGVTPGKVEGYYLKGYPSGLNYATDRGAVDSFTKNVLFPAYAKSGISINKNAYYGQDGHLYPGAGLAQWTGPRGQAYANMFASKGYKFGQIEPELEMMWSELNGGCRSYALAPWKAVTTPEAGADVFCRKFEGYSGADGIKKRQGYARGFYNSMSSIAGGSGEGAPDDKPAEQTETPVISKHRYSIAAPKPVEGGHGEIKKVKAPITTRALSKTPGFTKMVTGGSGQVYDDKNVLQLLSQIADFLGSITTNTKNLDLLNDIRSMSGGSSVNLTTVQGGDTTVNTVNSTTNNRKSSNRSDSSMTRQESNARKIAGIG